MPKNIVICCDGTGNQFGKNNSNVVKLYAISQKVPGLQIAYYDPGVGTNHSPGLGIPINATLKKAFGLITGYGLYQNVYEAYSYLMENYEKGDRVYLFGFSRGAYTVRVLSGFIHMLGLLEKGCQNLIPYAFELYGKHIRHPKTGKKKPDFATAGSFKVRFSRECPISFLGIWDTVASVGYFGNWKSYPYTRNNPNVSVIRHAIAIDERRAFYTQNKLGKAKEDQSIKEVWFAGVHSDVGGSYPEEESGLAQIALQWMLNEAAEAGLMVDANEYAEVVLDANHSKRSGPNPLGKLHRSLKGFWWIGEVIPKTRWNEKTTKFNWYVPWGTYREIPKNAYIHRSVIDRMEQSDYRPSNLPVKYQTEAVKEKINPRSDETADEPMNG